LPKQTERHAIALGERRTITARRRNLTAFFQDANYHDQIVKEQNKPTAMVSPPSKTKATPPRSAHDLLRHFCHGQRFDSDRIAKNRYPTRNGPQPMISVLNPIATTAASDCLERSLTNNRTRQRQGSGDHEPFGGNRSDTKFIKLALSDRPHDFGKVRRFSGERQAAVSNSSVSLFSG
jgi:hypothetical protein